MSDNPILPSFNPDPQASRITQSRVYIYNTIADLIVNGYSFEEILSLYSDVGANITPKELSQVYDIMSGTNTTIFEVPQVPQNMPIPPSVMDIFNVPHETNYRYIGEFVTFDNETGERKEWRFFLDSNDVLSRSLAANQMLEYWQEEYPSNANLFVSSINIIQAYRNF